MENLVQLAMQNVNFGAIMPSLVLTCFGLALLLINAFSPRGKTAHACWISIAALVVTGFVAASAWNNPQFGFAGSVALDNFASFFNFTFLLAAGLTILMSDDYLRREGYPVGEYYPLVLFTTAGAMWMASGTDLMTIFLGLEVLSISLYVLAGFFRSQTRSNEAGLKYFLLGAFSTGFLRYGIALLYGVAGTTNVADIGAYLSAQPAFLANPMTIAGMLLLSVGFLFKIAAAPFHMWTPDVYQGAPTNVTAFMAAATKAAGFAAALRLFLVAFPTLEALWVPALAVLAAITMLYGAYVAVVQRDLKRMLAYSSITHAGSRASTGSGISSGVTPVGGVNAIRAIARSRSARVPVSGSRPRRPGPLPVSEGPKGRTIGSLSTQPRSRAVSSPVRPLAAASTMLRTAVNPSSPP